MVKPYVNHKEQSSLPVVDTGRYIPIFIGATETTTYSPKILEFKKYEDAAKTTASGGLGIEPVDLNTNPLLKCIKEFYEEGEPIEATDLGLGTCYAIDMGIAPTTENWTAAATLAQTKNDAKIEVYLTSDVSVMDAVYTNIMDVNKLGALKLAYFIETDKTVSDADLIAKTNVSGVAGSFINKSRINIIENQVAGKEIAKLCYTPFDIEPGRDAFRSIEVGTLKERTPAQMDALSDAGIIFAYDDHFGATVRPVMNLATSTAWALNTEERPNDCLNHARRIADKVIEDVDIVAYNQLKRNETATNIAHVQTDVDTIVDTGIREGYLMEGTEITVEEADGDPFTLNIYSKIKPVNTSLYIEHYSTVSYPNVKVTS
jgi:hypothetical protein